MSSLDPTRGVNCLRPQRPDSNHTLRLEDLPRIERPSEGARADLRLLHEPRTGWSASHRVTPHRGRPQAPGARPVDRSGDRQRRAGRRGARRGGHRRERPRVRAAPRAHELRAQDRARARRRARSRRGTEEFAELIAREAGKPIAQARGRGRAGRLDLRDRGRGGDAHRRRGDAARHHGDLARLLGDAGCASPPGRCIAISPFNFPLNLVAHKLAPALACGCSVVLKPPPQTPLTSLLLAECIRQRGRPGRRGAGRPVRRRRRREARAATTASRRCRSPAARRSAGTSSRSPARSACCSSSGATRRSSCTTTRRSTAACDAHRLRGVRLRRAGVHQGAARSTCTAPSPTAFVARLVARTRAIEPHVAARSRRPCAAR